MDGQYDIGETITNDNIANEDHELKDTVVRTTYVCGGCGKDVRLDRDGNIKCNDCGHRIFYKKRDRKLL